jgi:hypothetical protein
MHLCSIPENLLISSTFYRKHISSFLVFKLLVPTGNTFFAKTLVFPHHFGPLHMLQSQHTRRRRRRRSLTKQLCSSSFPHEDVTTNGNNMNMIEAQRTRTKNKLEIRQCTTNMLKNIHLPSHVELALYMSGQHEFSASCKGFLPSADYEVVSLFDTVTQWDSMTQKSSKMAPKMQKMQKYANC